MPKATHYTPPLNRFLVTALYHQAKLEHIPMTALVNRIVEQSLQGGEGWKRATEQQNEQQLQHQNEQQQLQHPNIVPLAA